MSKRRKATAIRRGGKGHTVTTVERDRSPARDSRGGVVAVARSRPLCVLVAVIAMMSALALMWSGSRVGMFGLGSALFGRRAASSAARAASQADTARSEYVGADRESYRVQRRLPHDKDAFTQGLFFHNGFLYESTGLYGFSTLRKVRVDTGEVVQKVDLDDNLFGEGITKVGNSIYMLTWRERTGLVYDLDTFELQRTFSFTTTRNEGWGIVYDGEHLLVTDGSANVHVWDPDTFKEVRRLTVRSAGRPVNALNELELVGGELWANIWYSNKIARINPNTGDVIGFVDYERLNPPASRRHGEDVFNGIAWSNATQTLYLTGKKWHHVYETELVREAMQPPFPAPIDDIAEAPGTAGSASKGLMDALRRRMAREGADGADPASGGAKSRSQTHDKSDAARGGRGRRKVKRRGSSV